MYSLVFLVVTFASAAKAGIATSYSVGNLGVRGLGGGIGLPVIGDGVGLRGGIGLGHDDDIGLGSGRLIGGIVGGDKRVVDLWAPPRYQFKYGVGDPKTGDRKEQAEARVDDVVKGEYSLAEPDGTIRVVKYTADDKNGFNAVVSRIGKAAHPQIILTKGGLGLDGIGLRGDIF